ncbi:hypothetical protein K438DRAFT_417213 [Mycena galopus ATCC 62051]|nr:hypothetical protein K438DRAFT_417213 [Mycena galopus ATCC 62051]
MIGNELLLLSLRVRGPPSNTYSADAPPIARARLSAIDSPRAPPPIVPTAMTLRGTKRFVCYKLVLSRYLRTIDISHQMLEGSRNGHANPAPRTRTANRDLENLPCRKLRSKNARISSHDRVVNDRSVHPTEIP